MWKQLIINTTYAAIAKRQGGGLQNLYPRFNSGWLLHTGIWPRGKASDFDSDIRRFKSCYPCQKKRDEDKSEVR